MRLPLLLDNFPVGIRRRHGQLFRQQEIARITRRDLDHVAARAEIFDIFPKNDFHGSILSLLHGRRERQQRDVARLQDGVGQAALVRRADAGNAAGHDLAALGDERLQHPDVFVIDVVDLLDAETANLLAPEVLFLSHRGGFVATGGAL